MPCITEPPTHFELETKRLNDFLDETGEPTPRTHVSYLCQARAMGLDQMAAWLCAWCAEHDVSAKSLELQIWWRDHQRWDTKRQAENIAVLERARLQQQALAKLTADECAALNLPPSIPRAAQP